ncbi:MAG TPA: RHS repeat-associated core domain-containing protein, partial [Acidimicrobiales bacterium]|nr:RHS repeat-associated core domain-containing protein [Acidimicrobiales bacterium]
MFNSALEDATKYLDLIPTLSPPTERTDAKPVEVSEHQNLDQIIDNYGTSSYAVTTASHDAEGNLTQVSDDNGNTVSYQYAPGTNDLSCIAYPVATGSNCANPASASNTVVNYGYDSAGRMTSLSDWYGQPIQFGYSTDGQNRITSITYPTYSSPNEQVTYGYDLAGNMTSSGYVGPAVGSQSQSWTPNPDEFIGSSAQLSGFGGSDSYGTFNRLTQAPTPGNNSGYAYGYSPGGELTSATLSGQQAVTYSHDPASELTSISNPNPGQTATTTFANTPDGQRCWSNPSSVSSPTCGTVPSGSTVYAYDSYGHLCATGLTSSTSQPTCTTPVIGDDFTYDGRGLLRSATYNGLSGTTSANFTWDTLGKAPLLLSDGANAYIYGPTLFGGTAPVEQLSLTGGGTSYLSSMPSGVQLVFSQFGQLQEQAAYSPYGQLSIQSGSAATLFGFDGSYADPFFGLDYLVNRWYDPVTAQFVSIDPAVSETHQLYSFMSDDPVNGTDPLGLCASPDKFNYGTTYNSCIAAALAGWAIYQDAQQLATGQALSQSQGWGYIGAGEFLINHPNDLPDHGAAISASLAPDAVVSAVNNALSFLTAALKFGGVKAAEDFDEVGLALGVISDIYQGESVAYAAGDAAGSGVAVYVGGSI